ncbi:zinc ribbon domain-containing protein [Ferrimicrobium sp.]|uniref:zinc ribbon domain-containing protein n=1 Tax=Ferrimicrobium sp. TaxID=2926050 RepID=UPI00345B7D9B
MKWSVHNFAAYLYVGGSGIQTVNAAYTSQTCPDPTCGYVHSDNRHGDVFHCRNPYWECNCQGDVDHVAAMNIKSRIKDRQISRFTPYTEVKKILDERLLRRMQSRVGARIVPVGTTDNGVRDTWVENGATAHGPTPSKPRQRKLDVGGKQPPTRRVQSTRCVLGRLNGWRAKIKGCLEMPRLSGAASDVRPQ